MPLEGVATKSQANTATRTAFPSSWMVPEGSGPTKVVEGKVVDINLNLWTVDVVSQFDQEQYLNIQISSPYMHPNNGEGIYVMPDLGAKCHVCVPGDSTPPFLLDFIMPMETIPQAGSDEAPTGTSTQAPDESDASDADATFAGGRPRAKPGDIYIKGRNGNFVVLHRGGVLQIGATELAQRIYIPLQNLVSDISQNYRHYNTGGSINWFLAAGESETNPPTILKEAYRLLAGDEKASIRVTTGLAKDVVRESDGDVLLEQTTLGLGELGDDSPVVYEVVLAPETIGADNGSIGPDTSEATRLRFFFDKNGGTLFRTEGDVFIYAKRTLRALVQDLSFRARGDVTLVADGLGDWRFEGPLNINAQTMRLLGGSKPVAHVGSTVEVEIPVLTLVGLPAAPGANVVIPPINPLTGLPQKMFGRITAGNNKILV